MSPETGKMLIAVGFVLMTVGAAMLAASRRQARARRVSAPQVIRRRRRLGALSCTSLASGVIAGVQWAVLHPTSPTVTSAVTLGLPAFLAGATLARLLTVVRTIHRRRRAAQVGRPAHGRRR